jgi:hypothetical protein
MTILNFSHLLTEAQRIEILRVLELPDALLHTIPLHFVPTEPFAEQAQVLLATIPLTAEAWQTEPLLVVLPGHSVIAALILALLHGRCGYFPAVVRLRPVEGATVPTFEVAEIINLQALRESERATRPKGGRQS